LFALSCLVLWGLFGFMSKLVSRDLGPWQMQVLFTFGALPLIVPAWLRARGKMDRDKAGWALAALTGALAALANLALFYAIRSGDVSIVTPFTALSPLVTFVLGRVILKERMNRSQNLGVACAVVAILLLSM
jgi:bacterial/archaeal transporter family protein